MRSRSEMAIPLFACALLLAGATAAAAQVQNYPKAPSPYFGTNPNQNRDRGYMSKNPYDPNSIYNAGRSSPADRLTTPGGTGGIRR